MTGEAASTTPASEPSPNTKTQLGVVPPKVTTAVPKQPAPSNVTFRTGPVPKITDDTPEPVPATPASGRVPFGPNVGTQPGRPPPPPSQVTRPTPIVPGAAAASGPVPVESMDGPFPRAPETQSIPRATTQAIPKMDRPTTQPVPRTQPIPKQPVPGMTEADINALHAKYVKAKEMVGEKVEAGSREKLLKTIQQTAPKIMEQYKASGVDFSVVVKDNQVVIKAKPKT